MSKPVNENNTKEITQYWYRGKPNYVNRPHSNRQVNACKELNRLLDRIAELEGLIKYMRRPGKSVAGYIQRIAELEQERDRVCKWSCHSERDEFGNRYEYVKTQCGEETESKMCDNYCWNCGGNVEMSDEH